MGERERSLPIIEAFIPALSGFLSLVMYFQARGLEQTHWWHEQPKKTQYEFDESIRKKKKSYSEPINDMNQLKLQFLCTN